MPLCSACKSKKSDEQCPHESLNGILFCGRHMKTKSPRLWSAVNSVDKKVVLIQKIWKGYYVRNRLRLAGPGVLNRKVCSNSEELFTLDDPNSVHPFDYFAFEENSKVYWFNVKSMIQCLDSSDELTNPYTRQKTATDVKKRLYKIHMYRIRAKLPTLHTDPPFRPLSDILVNRFRHISHILQANEFFDLNPETFMALGPINIGFYILSLYEGFSDWALEHAAKPASRRHKYLLYIHDLPIKFQNCTYNQYLYVLSSVLLFILNDSSDPFRPCFIIMSSFHGM